MWHCSKWHHDNMVAQVHTYEVAGTGRHRMTQHVQVHGRHTHRAAWHREAQEGTQVQEKGLTKSAYSEPELHLVGKSSESIQSFIDAPNPSHLDRCQIMWRAQGSLPGLGTRPRGDVLKWLLKIW